MPDMREANGDSGNQRRRVRLDYCKATKPMILLAQSVPMTDNGIQQVFCKGLETVGYFLTVAVVCAFVLFILSVGIHEILLHKAAR